MNKKELEQLVLELKTRIERLEAATHNVPLVMGSQIETNPVYGPLTDHGAAPSDSESIELFKKNILDKICEANPRAREFMEKNEL